MASVRAAGPTLSLDLGTKFGWAVGWPDGRMTHGHHRLQVSRFDGGGMRYLRFRMWLDEIERAAGPLKRIVFEEVRRHAATDAAHVYGGLLATMQAWCEERNVPYGGVPVGQIKRFATGSGAAKKQAMIAAARERGFPITDDNEADALFIALGAKEGRW